jgi:hypothetical protein
MSCPPLATQAANLAGAAARFVASGLAVVDREEYDRRRAVCRACPTGHHDADQDRCRACGCSLAAKPWARAEDCPKGHWTTP